MLKVFYIHTIDMNRTQEVKFIFIAFLRVLDFAPSVSGIYCIL